MKKLLKLKTNLFSRNALFVEIAAKLGKDFIFSDKKENFDKLVSALSNRVEFLTDELGEIKGSFLKAGQMLSLYAGDLLPADLLKVLEKLQSETSYLEWKVISKNLPSHTLSELKIEEDAFAAASIGQVHRAIGLNGEEMALKIQYKNVEKLIDTDLRFIKLLVKAMKVVPKDLKLEKAFDEVKRMLIVEMNYKEEVKNMNFFRDNLNDDYIIPIVYERYSSKKEICMSYIESKGLEEELRRKSLEEKVKLAESFFTLFLKEIFILKRVQSDAHMGNFLIQNDKWVLLDFGATKELSDELARQYQQLIEAFFKKDINRAIDVLKEQEAINFEKSNMNYFYEYCEIVSGPLQNLEYDWANSDVATRLMKKIDQTTKNITLNHIPFENIFIDRKIVGVFYMLKKIGVPLNLHKLFYKFRADLV